MKQTTCGESYAPKELKYVIRVLKDKTTMVMK